MRNRDNPQKKFKGIFTKFLENVKRVVYTVVSECAEFKSGHRLEFRLTHFCVLRPSHTPTETTKTLLSSIHTETLFNNRNNFFNSFIYGQRFSQELFWKNLCENRCSVRGPLPIFWSISCQIC